MAENLQTRKLSNVYAVFMNAHENTRRLVLGSSPLARTTVVAWRDDEVMVMMLMTCIARTDLEVDAIAALWRHD